MDVKWIFNLGIAYTIRIELRIQLMNVEWYPLAYMQTSGEVSVDALAAAVLASQGQTQVEIASALDLSQSAVSRLLRDVQDYIHVERTFRWDRLAPSVQREVRRRISHRVIADRLADLAKEHGQSAPAVHVVPLDDSAEIGRQFDRFATRAAIVLRDLLEGVGGRVGVAWGSTIWHATQALRSVLLQRPFHQRVPIEFIPLCGDPLIDSQERYADRTSSRIVSELSRTVNGDGPRPAWLGLVPAFIPRTFEKDRIRVIDRLIDLVPQYPESSVRASRNPVQHRLQLPVIFT